MKMTYRFEGQTPGIPNPSQPIVPPIVIIEKIHLKVKSFAFCLIVQDGVPSYTITIQNQPNPEIKITSESYKMVKDVLRFFDAPTF